MPSYSRAQSGTFCATLTLSLSRAEQEKAKLLLLESAKHAGCRLKRQTAESFAYAGSERHKDGFRFFQLRSRVTDCTAARWVGSWAQRGQMHDRESRPEQKEAARYYTYSQDLFSKYTPKMLKHINSSC